MIWGSFNVKEFSMKEVGFEFKAIMFLYDNSKEGDKIYNIISLFL